MTNVVQELGWGRLVFGQTFDDQEVLSAHLRDEASGRRDICMYLDDPHILVATHPSEYFIDPSYTYRFDLADSPVTEPNDAAVVVEEVTTRADCVEINRLYVRRNMVPADVDQMWHNHTDTDSVMYLVARDRTDGTVWGTVTGVDHTSLFDDADNGCSLWCLAVDPECPHPGVGRILVESLLARMAARGRSQLDLSVIHDNKPARQLYEQMGFRRVAVFGLKRKNAINEPLFTSSDGDLDALNPYARIVADEAIRRGIRVQVLDADTGYLQLEHGGRTVITRESLTQYTSAVAMSRCDDKRITRKVVAAAGVVVPQGRTALFDDSDKEFLAECGALVVKPARGEQGAGITVDVRTPEELEVALSRAGGVGTEILLEQYCPGQDLRVIVINGKVIAAAIRKPAEVVGTGRHTVQELIERQSRRRSAATAGESRIPLDGPTEDAVREGGHEMSDVLPVGERLQVRKTANLHTGGTIHDVTDRLHPTLADAAVQAAEAIGIPVTGIDLLVPDPTGPDYVFIEANERPGLANHEPQPVAQAFMDYLFPNTRATPWAWQPDTPPSANEQ